MPYYIGMKTGRPLKSTRTDFAAKLAELRTEAGLSQREVAARLGISQPSYALWEQRNVAITAEQIMRLATTLNVTANELLGENGTQKRFAGPAGKMRQLFEAASRLPRSQQQKITAILAPFVAQHTQAREA